MTAGALGTIERGPEQTAKLRMQEAAAAAAMIGATYRCLLLADLGLFNDDPTRRRVVGLIRELAPDLILTAAPADYHPDHEATSLLVRDACFAVTVPNYKAGSAPCLATIPHLYFMDPIEGCDRSGAKVVPDFAVDVTQFMEMKRRMLSAHMSQREWVRKQHGIDDYLGAMEAWTAKRGKTFGVSFAEGFRQYTSHPYPRTKLLQAIVRKNLLVES